MSGKHYVFDDAKNKHEAMTKEETRDFIALVVDGHFTTDLHDHFKNDTTAGEYPDEHFLFVYSSHCTNFNFMFSGCTGLTKVSDLDTKNGTNFNYVFSRCTSLTEIPDLDTKNGTTFNHMFNECTSLTEIPDLDTKNGTEVTSFGYMFQGCTSLTHFRDNPNAPEGSRWQCNASINFGDCPLDRESILKVFNGLQTVSSKTITISKTTNGYLSADDKAIATAKGWTINVQS